MTMSYFRILTNTVQRAVVLCGCVVLLQVIAAPANATIVFDLIGRNATTALHTRAPGYRTASGSWGFSATGGGFMDSRVFFKDSFLLPGLPNGNTTFSASDLEGFEFHHNQSAFIGGGAITPVFGFQGDNSDISSASGQVINLGNGEFRISNLFLQTSINLSLFRLPGGVVTGQAYMNGMTVGILADTIGGVPQAPGTHVEMVINSEYKGDWKLTEITSVPAPGTLFLFSFVLGLFALTSLRHRQRQPEGV